MADMVGIADLRMGEIAHRARLPAVQAMAVAGMEDTAHRARLLAVQAMAAVEGATMAEAGRVMAVAVVVAAVQAMAVEAVEGAGQATAAAVAVDDPAVEDQVAAHAAAVGAVVAHTAEAAGIITKMDQIIRADKHRQINLSAHKQAARRIPKRIVAPFVFIP